MSGNCSWICGAWTPSERRGHHPVPRKSVAGKPAGPVAHGVVRGRMPSLGHPALNAAPGHWVAAAGASTFPQISPGRVSADHGSAQRGTAAAPDTGPGVAVPGLPGQDWVDPQTRCKESAEQTDLPAPASRCLENTMTQQIEAGTPAHGALDCFQVADLSFHRSGTPG
jgi:hypothetical protein